jgi:hypothetical protein
MRLPFQSYSGLSDTDDDLFQSGALGSALTLERIGIIERRGREKHGIPWNVERGQY